MNIKGLFYLGLSRYITYIGAFIASILTDDRSFNDNIMFCLMFLVVLGNSSIRVLKLVDKRKLFILSLLFETVVIVIMKCMFSSMTSAYFYILIVDLFLFLEIKYSVVLSIFLCFSYFCSSLYTTENFNLSQYFRYFFMELLMLGFFAASAYLIRREFMMKTELQVLNAELTVSKAELEEVNSKLKDYAARVEELSVLDERNRIAGEIHDAIGHNLTGLIMEIDICRRLISKDVDKTRTELDKASQLARSALSEVRKSVRAIKPEDYSSQTGISAIRELIREFEVSSVIIVGLMVSKQKYKLSPTIDVTVYRAIQEALTNCAKYSGASRLDITIDFLDNSLELVIEDNGKGCGEFVKGLGLKTMEERIAELGGQIAIEHLEGFKIKITIPVGEVK